MSGQSTPSRPSSGGHSSAAQVYPQPAHHHRHQQSSSEQNEKTHQPQQQLQSGGLLYNNLIPGHYRYGAAPPTPPVGPLSYSNISQNSQPQQQQQRMNGSSDSRQKNNYDAPHEQQSQYHHYNNVPNSYANVPSATQTNNHITPNTSDVFLQVSEPDDEFDDDLLVIASSDMMEEIDLDDEKYYKPFRHLSGSSGGSVSGNTHQSQAASSKGKKSTKSSKPVKNTKSSTNKEDSKPMDLLAVLLSGPAAAAGSRNANTIDGADVTILLEEAAAKSSRARSMTNALVLQEKEHQQETKSDEIVDNDLYVETANAHTEAAISFQFLYKKLLGLENEGDVNQRIVGTLSPSEELAKSMIILANGHARTAKSLGEMGVKWNMGKVDKCGRMVSKIAKDVNTDVNNKGPTNASRVGDLAVATTAAAEKRRRESESSNERLRMAVRGALDTANHEDDITNSTFLARSTVLSANKKLTASSKVPVHSTTNNKKNRTNGKRGDGGVNPVDDLMKLEKELRSMDMALEMGTSVASLGTAVASRPNDLLGGSYMSSSSMWTSGIFGGRKPNAKQQQGTAGVRSRANHLQQHLPGGVGKPPAHALTSTSESISPTSQQQQGVQITPNASLDQSWWGGGGGQGSILASSAITTAAASHQRNQQTSGLNQVNTSTNAKQLMQLMDSLNRLGNENAQLMREVEEAKAARAEAEAAKQMMAQFKADYNQRFNKVKEALEQYKHASGDNPVGNSAYVKSASALELQKRDQMIKKLAADLRKERDESKKKDTALRKYEGFYREVKKRSAEKREQQLKQQQANAAANKK